MKKHANWILFILMFCLGAMLIPAQGDDAAGPQGIEAKKIKCPRLAPVMLEAVKPVTFYEYRHLSGQSQYQVVAVTSPVAGVVSEIRVSEGSLVEPGQELAVLNAGLDEKVKALAQDVEKKKKIWFARQNWKEKSEKAIQSAEKDYLAAAALLEETRALANRVIQAPLAGIVRVGAAFAAEVSQETLLFEIVDPLHLQVDAEIGRDEAGFFSSGEKLPAVTEGVEDELEAEIIAVEEKRVRFRVNNLDRQLSEGITIRSHKLKAEHAAALTVPVQAILQDNLGDFVYTVEKKKAKKTYVTVGAREAGRAMIEKGLAADTQLIVSGFECLADKKKIRVVNQEEMTKVEAQAKAEQKKAAAAPKEEKPVVGEKVRLYGERLRLAVHGTYYMMSDDNYKDTYTALSGFGGSLAFRFASKMDFWVSGGLAAKKNTPEWSPEELKFTLIPLSAAVRYYFVEKDKLSAYVGAGPIVFLVKDLNPVGDIKTTLIGANALVGGNYMLSRKIFAQLFLKFNLAQKDLYPETDLDDPLNLSGLELNLGIGILL